MAPPISSQPLAPVLDPIVDRLNSLQDAIDKVADSVPGIAVPDVPYPVPSGCGGGADPALVASREQAAERAQELDANPPDPGDYNNPFEYLRAYSDYKEAQRAAHQDLLDAAKAEGADRSDTGATIIEAAEREGLEIVVMTDEAYDEAYPGTGGVTVGQTVYVPVRALESNSGVLEHELLHALLNQDTWIFDDSFSVGPFELPIPMEMRVAAARERFEEIGLDPDDGERLVRHTDGMNKTDAHHVQTYVSGVDMYREENCLPPLTDEQRDLLYELAAVREDALGVWRHRVEVEEGEDPFTLSSHDDAASLEDALAEMSDEEVAPLSADLEARWEASVLGQDNPLQGDTPEERLVEMYEITEKAQREDPLHQFKE